MMEDTLVKHCAPTLAGLKTGSTFNIKSGGKNLRNEICRLNGVLTKKGLRLVPIKQSGDHTLMYLYRPDRLERDLGEPLAEEMLKEKGYPCGKAECCIVRLAKLLKGEGGFPHEIGLFLGYPPEDVKAFMESPREKVKVSGHWKAYSNPEGSRSIMERFRKCSALYEIQLNKGRPLERLIVDTRKVRCGGAH